MLCDPRSRVKLSKCLSLVAVLFALSLTACSDSSSNVFNFEVDGALVEVKPGLMDDTITITFSSDANENDAEDLSNYLLESPIGTFRDISGSTIRLSSSDEVVTIVLAGAGDRSINLVPGTSFKLTVSDVRSVFGTSLSSDNDEVGGTVSGGANPAPVLLTASPSSGATPGGDVITVTGTGFTATEDTTLAFGNELGLNVQVLNGGTVTVETPASGIGGANIIMMNSGGLSNRVMFRFVLPLPAFETAPALLSGMNPYSATVADFDDDGILDVLCANNGSDDIYVYRGLGEAKFSLSTILTLNSGAGAHTLRTGDFNGDGSPDIIVTKSSNGNFWVYLYEGVMDGIFQFSENVRTRVERLPEGIGLDDLNADGFLDAVIVNKADGILSVCLGDGTGAFSVNSLSRNSLAPVDVGLGDVNGDGFLDAVTANLDARGSVSIYIGDGAGGLTRTGEAMTGGIRAQGIELIDVTDDGILDVVVCNLESSSISVLSGDGLGAFLSPMLIPSAFGLIEVRVADLNGDDILDIAAAVEAGNQVVIHHGLGSGAFDDGVLLTCGAAPFDLTVGDLNNDGLLDLITPLEGGQAIALLLNSDEGFFQPGSFDVGERPQILVSADFNGDGLTDLVTLNEDGNDTTLLLARGGGQFDVKDGPVPTSDIEGLAAADVNGDGIDDILMALPDVNSIGVYLNLGECNFAPPILIAGGNRPGSVYTGDVNGDNIVDIASVMLFPGATNILLGDGTGNFTQSAFLLEGSDPLTGLVIEDINGDGNNDVAISQQVAATGLVAYFPGNGDGTFGESVRRDAREQVKDIAAGDFNGDGHMDLVVVGTEANNDVARVLINDGKGQFPMGADQIFLMTGFRGRDVAVGDVDADGAIDIITSNLLGHTVTVFLMNPADVGHPRETLQLVTGSQPSDVRVLDLDGRGNLDIVTCDNLSDTVTLLFSR